MNLPHDATPPGSESRAALSVLSLRGGRDHPPPTYRSPMAIPIITAAAPSANSPASTGSTKRSHRS